MNPVFVVQLKVNFRIAEPVFYASFQHVRAISAFVPPHVALATALGNGKSRRWRIKM
jgi:hypothetical protein